MTKIQWTDRSWNPVRGCSRISKGCERCYAERQAARFADGGIAVRDSASIRRFDGPFHGFVTKVNGHAVWTGRVELIASKLLEPLSWRKPCRVFVNSMSDLFHEALPDEAIDRVFAVMALCPHITFQVLTKRPERMRRYFSDAAELRIRWHQVLHDVRVFPGDSRRAVLGNPSRAGIAEGIIKGWRSLTLPNVWLGVSVEDQTTADARIPLLLQTPAAVRFVSYEPALGLVNFKGWLLDEAYKRACGVGHISWLIVGGESGPGARPFDVAWAKSAIEQCQASGVPVFMKQFGANISGEPIEFPSAIHDVGDGHKTFRLLDRKGGDPSEWPAWARMREFPQ